MTRPVKPSQNSFILTWLQTEGSITPIEALEIFGCYRLSARIKDLRQKGHKITTTIEAKDGKRYARYVLGDSMRIYFKPDMDTPAHSMQVPNELSVLQQLVNGYIEVHHIGKDVLLICNEEGKLMGMKPTLEDPIGTVVGPVLFTGSKGEHFAALSDKQVEYLKERYGWN